MNLDFVLRGIAFAAVMWWLVLFVRSFVDRNDRPPEPEGE